MDPITLAIWYNKQREQRKEKYNKHSKRNKAIEMCKKIGLTWKANDRTIKIVEWNETFTHSQTNELIRKLNSLDAY